MQTKDIIYKLRTESGMSQEELAAKVYVTRQAVSRWETGETVPNTETLMLLSEVFGVSVNALLGGSQRLICQCCGMPIDANLFGRNKDGTSNAAYCKWCYADGTYTYHDMDNLIDVCVPYMVKEGFTEQEAREHLRHVLPTLDYWRNIDELGDDGAFEALKRRLIDEINDLHVEGMPTLHELSALVGAYVNLDYPLPNGKTTKFLDDQMTYLGYELHSETTDGLCYGIVANADFILVCSYTEGGENPTLLVYKKR